MGTPGGVTFPPFVTSPPLRGDVTGEMSRWVPAEADVTLKKCHA